MKEHIPPLAERMRPKVLDDLVGQEHLTGKGSILRTSLEQGRIPSMILWGPPGVGKTTLASIIAKGLSYPFFTLSAVSSGVKEVRESISEASKVNGAILFIDEIHRFNKGQQDALLGAVEKGIITLIGATTENPSFEVNSALLSRCQVYVLKPLGYPELLNLMKQALEKDPWLHRKELILEQTEALLRLSGGDGRKLLNLLELVGEFKGVGGVITNTDVMEIAQRRIALYDKGGDQHFDIISAFIKSIRGSDPNGALYWLARMIEGGEEIKFIARRMVILASEDIGNANPNALILATSTFQAVEMIGLPESRIILSQCAIYLAVSLKSNSSYIAISKAQEEVFDHGDLPVPLHLRNAPTQLMKSMEFGKGYQYSHDFEGNFANQEYLPDQINGKKFYEPGNNPREEEFRKFLKRLWNRKYEY